VNLEQNSDVKINPNDANILPIDPMPIDPLPVADSIEPNDTLDNAIDTNLSSDKPGKYRYNGSIGDNSNLEKTALDVDLFKVQLNPGDRLTLKTEAISPIIYYDQEKLASPDDSIMPPDPYPQLDSILRLFDADGNQLAINDYFYIDDNNYLDAFIDYKATTSGTYYVGISGYGNFEYDPNKIGSGTDSYSQGQYSLEISAFPSVNSQGTTGNDLLFGSEGDNNISGLDGNDKIESRAGSDSVTGNSGDDWIVAGSGNDTASGGKGDDRISGDVGDDILSGEGGLDIVFGGSGNDVISGGGGKDRLFGETGNDRISGDGGNDAIEGGQGFDTISGNSGQDSLSGDAGDDLLAGGAGNDLIAGGDDWDTLAGNKGDDTLYGGLGSDVLDGGEGDDRLIGYNEGGELSSYETDTLTGGVGRDIFVLADSDRIYYDDNDSQSSGDYDYALITDFNAIEDSIQLKGSADLYSLDFFTTLGRTDAAIIYDPGVETKGEVIGIIQAAAENLSLNEGYFSFV
jgi:serralysin